MNKKDEKVIRVAIRNGDDTKVKVDFHGGVFSVEEFTSLFMAVLETYTAGMINKNGNEKVFEHWNNVFGIFLNKIVPPSKHYELSTEHKEFKEKVDATLGREETEEDKKKYLANADIIVVAVGRKWFLNSSYTLKDSAVLVDVGINRVDGKLHGDIEPNLPVRLQTPVPGGVGLLTRLALLENLMEAYNNNK